MPALPATSPRVRLLPALCAAILPLLAAGSVHAGSGEGGPFAGLAGSWSGSGTVTTTSGASERIRCRATYAVGGGGNSLRQSLTCASDSYKMNVSSDIEAQGGTLSGRWSEATRGVSGAVSGRVSGGVIQATVQGPTFSAGVGVNTRGGRQSVTITSQSGEIRTVSITLSR